MILLDFNNNSYIGIFFKVCDKYLLIPNSCSSTNIKKLHKELGVKFVVTDLCASSLIGVFAAANSKCIIVPKFVLNEELSVLESLLGINVYVLQSKLTALGNNILVNDTHALINPKFTNREVKEISDALDVEVMQYKICNCNTVGSVAVVTNKGLVVGSAIKPSELKTLTNFFLLEPVVSTVNFGCSYVASGIVANSYGAVVGSASTGIELGKIQEALFSK